MNDEQLDRLFENTPEVPAGLAEKIRARIESDTQPVKPLPGSAVYALIFWGIAVMAALAFAAILQFKGLRALTAQAAVELVAMLAIAGLLGVIAAARGMRPASGRLHSWLIGGAALVVYEALVIWLFHDYTSANFLPSGSLCLALGVLCGAFAAVPLWLIVRQGLVVQPASTGAAIGLAGGLSGLTFLTLHCAILTVPHTSVWHAAVLVVCVGAGALAAKIRL